MLPGVAEHMKKTPKIVVRRRETAPRTLQKSLIALVSALVLIASGPGTIRAQSAPITVLELRHCNLQFYTSYTEKIESIKNRLDDGLQRLNVLFDKPPLKARPVFWLVSNEEEMKAALAHKSIGLGGEALKAALARRAYRDDVNVIVQMPVGAHDDWLLRILYTEHVRTLADATAPTAQNLRIGWFYAGLSTYLAWMVTAEQDKQSRKVYENYMLKYYGPLFDPDKYIPLELLEVPKDWEAAIQSNPAAAYSQAALTYLYLAKLKGPRVGIMILRNFEKEDAFQTAFERATDLQLKQFERAMIKELYPEIKALREGK